MKKHILHAVQTELAELFCHCRADTLEYRQWGVFCDATHLAGWPTEQRRIESLSISTALGRGKLARQAMATVR